MPDQPDESTLFGEFYDPDAKRVGGEK
jgi:hypothetical protein